MKTLLANGPSNLYATEMEQFGRLAGHWATRITYYPTDGSPARHVSGEWEFGYALEGRAVLDVWRWPGREELLASGRAPDQECGLCVRIWDPRLQLWRFTFHGTAHGDLVHMYARQIDDEIVMERAAGGDLVRWTFTDITAAAFHWRNERSTDGGHTWRLDQEADARRREATQEPG
ncbi:hypothetical protein [Streptomyces sparsogenes]|uniref:DUF1579 domain-containing protein n=1 Tax=Streptomyces sparsogenes DSM 40356 TaxID=1331668 RepID=A0A1R1SBX3_9ACTN|nr:hypothetical protein [Streptomyces sparsogenes]OMI35783.1 hypothetical protein SPAR_29511 [Streptomyces sparsogenes DSM 40356]